MKRKISLSLTKVNQKTKLSRNTDKLQWKSYKKPTLQLHQKPSLQLHKRLSSLHQIKHKNIKYCSEMQQNTQKPSHHKFRKIKNEQFQNKKNGHQTNTGKRQQNINYRFRNSCDNLTSNQNYKILNKQSQQLNEAQKQLSSIIIKTITQNRRKQLILNNTIIIQQNLNYQLNTRKAKHQNYTIHKKQSKFAPNNQVTKLEIQLNRFKFRLNKQDYQNKQLRQKVMQFQKQRSNISGLLQQLQKNIKQHENVYIQELITSINTKKIVQSMKNYEIVSQTKLRKGNLVCCESGQLKTTTRKKTQFKDIVSLYNLQFQDTQFISDETDKISCRISRPDEQQKSTVFYLNESFAQQSRRILRFRTLKKLWQNKQNDNYLSVADDMDKSIVENSRIINQILNMQFYGLYQDQPEFIQLCIEKIASKLELTRKDLRALSKSFKNNDKAIVNAQTKIKNQNSYYETKVQTIQQQISNYQLKTGQILAAHKINYQLEQQIISKNSILQANADFLNKICKLQNQSQQYSSNQKQKQKQKQIWLNICRLFNLQTSWMNIQEQKIQQVYDQYIDELLGHNKNASKQSNDQQLVRQNKFQIIHKTNNESIKNIQKCIFQQSIIKQYQDQFSREHNQTKYCCLFNQNSSSIQQISSNSNKINNNFLNSKMQLLIKQKQSDNQKIRNKYKFRESTNIIPKNTNVKLKKKQLFRYSNRNSLGCQYKADLQMGDNYRKQRNTIFQENNTQYKYVEEQEKAGKINKIQI